MTIFPNFCVKFCGEESVEGLQPGLSGVEENASPDGSVEVPSVAALQEGGEMIIDEPDFTAWFQASIGKWKVKWKWAREKFDNEILQWIENGWLIPYDEGKWGPPKAVIPFLCVVQPHKSKVRPCLDFRFLNDNIQKYSARADVCGEKIRTWRKMGSNTVILDLYAGFSGRNAVALSNGQIQGEELRTCDNGLRSQCSASSNVCNP